MEITKEMIEKLRMDTIKELVKIGETQKEAEAWMLNQPDGNLRMSLQGGCTPKELADILTM